MDRGSSYHGALIVSGYEQGMLEEFAELVAAAFEDFGHPVERCSLSDSRNARVTATHYAARLTLTPGPSAEPSLTRRAFDTIAPGHAGGPARQWRLKIEMQPADAARDDKDISELLLAVMLYRALHEFDTRMVEWLDPLTILATAEFLSAFGSIAPCLVQGDEADIYAVNGFGGSEGTVAPQSRRHPFPLLDAPEEETDVFYPEDALALAYRTAPVTEALPPVPYQPETGPSSIQRLAVWAMTGVIAFLSMPVALSVAAVNLLRGEDLRLNTQVLSLTGLLVMLHATGALESLAAELPL